MICGQWIEKLDLKHEKILEFKNEKAEDLGKIVIPTASAFSLAKC